MSNLQEKAIQATDLDAIEAKSYAVKLGYWNDPYVNFFNLKTKNKAPEINRGYFARTKSIENITKEFIMQNEDAQIINIGAGCDTLYFRLLDQGVTVKKFIELDLPENVFRKINFMSKKKAFHDLLGLDASIPQKVESQICRDPYYLFACDLRSNANELINFWRDNAGINLNSPTLFIAECVLVYISTEVVNIFLETVSHSFPKSAVLSYDPINMNDAFGKVMVQNLRMRNIELRGMSACDSKETIEARYRECKFVSTKVWSMSEVYKSLPVVALRRIEALEMLDDPQMMTQLFDHYCLVLASTRSALFTTDDLVPLLAGIL